MNPNVNPYNVAEGQIWESCDPRDDKRSFRVIAVSSLGFATVQGLQVQARRQIALRRFFTKKTKGYRKLSES